MPPTPRDVGEVQMLRDLVSELEQYISELEATLAEAVRSRDVLLKAKREGGRAAAAASDSAAAAAGVAGAGEAEGDVPAAKAGATLQAVLEENGALHETVSQLQRRADELIEANHRLAAGGGGGGVGGARGKRTTPPRLRRRGEGALGGVLQPLRPRALQPRNEPHAQLSQLLHPSGVHEPRPVWKPAWRVAGPEPRPQRTVGLEQTETLDPDGTLAMIQEVRALCDEAREALG